MGRWILDARTTITTPQIAAAPAPAMANTLCRSGSRKESVESRKRSMPANSTTATGQIVFSCQLTRIEDIFPPAVPSSLDRTLFSISGIGMQSRQQVRHAEESEHHHRKSENRKVRGPAPPPAAGNAHVQISRIH